MSDQVQLPTSAPFAPIVTPAPRTERVEPAKQSQADNRNSGDQRPNDDRPPTLPSAANRHLTITREPALQSFVYRSIDKDSGEVVWQWPAEQVLRRARHLRELEEKRQNELDEKA